jgi:HEAT repeat protein
MTGDQQPLNGEPAGDADHAEETPQVDPAEVIDEIAANRGAVAFTRLRSLSAPSDESIAIFVSLWPRVPPERRREVLASLQQLGDEDSTLDFHRIHLSALRDEDAATRILAIRGLWEQDRLEYMHLLLDQVRDDAEATVRAACADALGQWVVGAEFGLLSDDESDHLCSLLREVVDDINEEDEVRGRALEAVGARSEESVSELISEAYETGTLRMRLASLRAMGRNADDNWLPVLIYNFDDADTEIRAAAAEAAGELLLEDAIDPLTSLIDDADEDVQLAAIHALGEIAGAGAERVLSAVLARPEQRLVEAAQEALDGVRVLAADQVEREDEEL